MNRRDFRPSVGLLAVIVSILVFAGAIWLGAAFLSSETTGGCNISHSKDATRGAGMDGNKASQRPLLFEGGE